jgi:hypothetical protein
MVTRELLPSWLWHAAALNSKDLLTRSKPRLLEATFADLRLLPEVVCQEALISGRLQNPRLRPRHFGWTVGDRYHCPGLLVLAPYPFVRPRQEMDVVVIAYCVALRHRR